MSTTHPDPLVEREIAKAEEQLRRMRHTAGGSLRLAAFQVRDTMHRIIGLVDGEQG